VLSWPGIELPLISIMLKVLDYVLVSVDNILLLVQQPGTTSIPLPPGAAIAMPSPICNQPSVSQQGPPCTVLLSVNVLDAKLRLAVAHPPPPSLQGFLVRPWLLLALQHDPHFLYHMVSAAALMACVIGPALRSQPVSTTWRAASHTSLRVLHSATSLHSASLPGGVYRQYVLSMLAQGGRWKVFASVAWCHGLLLQVGGPHLCACDCHVLQPTHGCMRHLA
jgi:hypothetical protein